MNKRLRCPNRLTHFVSLIWVPGHRNIDRNGRTDELVRTDLLTSYIDPKLMMPPSTYIYQQQSNGNKKLSDCRA